MGAPTKRANMPRGFREHMVLRCTDCGTVWDMDFDQDPQCHDPDHCVFLSPDDPHYTEYVLSRFDYEYAE